MTFPLALCFLLSTYSQTLLSSDNDSDPDGDALTFCEGSTLNEVGAGGTGVGGVIAVGQNVDLAQGGTINVGEDGCFTYSPGGDFESLGTGETAEVCFTYTACDPFDATSSETTACIIISGSNDPPVAGDDTYTGTEGVDITGNIMGKSLAMHFSIISALPSLRSFVFFSY